MEAVPYDHVESTDAQEDDLRMSIIVSVCREGFSVSTSADVNANVLNPPKNPTHKATTNINPDNTRMHPSNVSNLT